MYIAKRRNKWRNIFGFVRFEGVDDQERLDNQLRNIWFGTYITWVNISKFERNLLHGASDTSVRRKEETFRLQEEKRQRVISSNSRDGFDEGKRKDGISYADAIINNGNHNSKSEAFHRRHNGRKEIHKEEPQEWVRLSLNVSEEEML